MYRFRVYDPAGPDGSWSLQSAHLVGSDGRSAPGIIRRDGAFIVCEPEGNRSIGLALLVSVGGDERTVLQTCLLPARPEPYDLSIEIARWAIKQWLERCEAWQMWRPSLSADSAEKWEDARVCFRAALKCDDPVEAERLARKSIAVGIDAAESLTERHADFLLAQRFRRKGASAATFGVCVDPALPPTVAACAAAKLFDVIALRTSWREIEPKAGKRDYSKLDAWMQWATNERKFIVLGPILDFSVRNGAPCELPAHVIAALKKPKQFRELVHDHATDIASRYPGVKLAIASSGTNLPYWGGYGLDQIFDWMRVAITSLRTANRSLNSMIELQSIAGEEWKGATTFAWPVSFVQRIVSENLPIAAIGLRVVEGVGSDAVHDLLTLATVIDRFRGLEVRTLVSAFGMPSAGATDRVGVRRAGWSDEVQRAWGGSVARVALGRPFIEAAWWSRLQDAAGGPHDGVLDVAGRAKPVLRELVELKRRVSVPLGGLEVDVV